MEAEIDNSHRESLLATSLRLLEVVVVVRRRLWFQKTFSQACDWCRAGCSPPTGPGHSKILATRRYFRVSTSSIKPLHYQLVPVPAQETTICRTRSVQPCSRVLSRRKHPVHESMLGLRQPHDRSTHFPLLIDKETW